MALTLISFVTTIMLVAGLLSSRAWLDRSQPDNLGIDDLVGSPSGSHNHHTPPPRPYLYKYPMPMSYYYRRRLPDYDRRYGSEARGYELASFEQGPFSSGLDKSQDFFYILPILLVIGLGSFLIPIISTFFTAMVTSNGAIGGCCGRKRRRNADKNKPVSETTLDSFWSLLVSALDKDLPDD